MWFPTHSTPLECKNGHTSFSIDIALRWSAAFFEVPFINVKKVALTD